MINVRLDIVRWSMGLEAKHEVNHRQHDIGVSIFMKKCFKNIGNIRLANRLMIYSSIPE
jgi:hypothetical protein